MNKNVSPGTIARTINLALALLNQVLTMTGHSVINIDNDTVVVAVTSIWSISAALLAWWKNNSFTDAAIEADDYLSDLREAAEMIAQNNEGGCDNGN